MNKAVKKLRKLKDQLDKIEEKEDPPPAKKKKIVKKDATPTTNSKGVDW